MSCPRQALAHPSQPLPGLRHFGVCLWSGWERLAEQCLACKTLGPTQVLDSPKPRAGCLCAQVSAGLRRCPALFSQLIPSGVGPKCSPVAPCRRWSGRPWAGDPSLLPQHWEQGSPAKTGAEEYMLYMYIHVYISVGVHLSLKILFPPTCNAKSPIPSASEPCSAGSSSLPGHTHSSSSACRGSGGASRTNSHSSASTRLPPREPLLAGMPWGLPKNWGKALGLEANT